MAVRAENRVVEFFRPILENNIREKNKVEALITLAEGVAWVATAVFSVLTCFYFGPISVLTTLISFIVAGELNTLNTNLGKISKVEDSQRISYRENRHLFLQDLVKGSLFIQPLFVLAN